MRKRGIMGYYKVVMKYSNGEEVEYDEEFDTVDDANEFGEYLVGCSGQGATELSMSNPGDYSTDNYVEPDFEIVYYDDWLSNNISITI